MPCQRPIEAWKPAAGGPLLFQKPKNGRAFTKTEIPCGYCILCREEQARQQAIRIYHEAQLYADNSFITLTYDDEHLPKHGSLQYEHLVKFWKRLRKLVRKRSKKDRTIHPRLRYYAVGEYGDTTLRPHYHACLFGHAFLDQRILVRTSPPFLWTHPELQECWGLGFVGVGDLNFTTAAYTASYLTKKLRSKQQYVRVDEETGELIRLEQPRAFMSKNLGKAWWMKWHQQTIDHDYVIINGRKQKPPKAYDRWLGEASPEIIERVKEERKKIAKANAKTPDQTHARAQNAHARAKNRKKSV